VQIELPIHLVRLPAALDFWQYKGRWDSSGFDWHTISQQRGHPVRTALINGQLGSFAFTEAGELIDIPPALWGSRLLWSEAYETTLTDVPIGGGLVTGYLCVDRYQLEGLWRAQRGDQRAEAEAEAGIDLDLVERTVSACPTIGLVARAIAMKADARYFATVDSWLREHWPDDMAGAWPNRVDSPTPSIAKQLNVAIRLVPIVPLKWQAAEPDDELVFELKHRYPILAAAVEVHRLCHTDALDDRGKVYVGAARRALELRVGAVAKRGTARQLLEAVAKLSIPEHKVSGGGRKTRLS
jgi:hypothetical protein